jgi:hypothetical protein
MAKNRYNNTWLDQSVCFDLSMACLCDSLACPHTTIYVLSWLSINPKNKECYFKFKEFEGSAGCFHRHFAAVMAADIFQYTI